MSGGMIKGDPFRPSGRKHYIPADHHKNWDFLTHYPHKKELISYEDQPCMKNCKFGKGFQRRSVHKIFPNKEEKRLQTWERAICRRNEHEKNRRELLRKRTSLNGDLIKCKNIPEKSQRQLFPIKRKVTFNDEFSKRDKIIRDKVSKNRFFHPELSSRPQIKKIVLNDKHFSSDIKIGRNDIKSKGVLDNFQGFGY